MKTFHLALAGVLLTTGAMAADQAPSQMGLGGPVIPGVCLLSEEAVLANAKAGVAATVRLQQLSKEAQDEVGQQQGPIEAEAKALEAQRASLKPEEYKDKQQALAVRLQVVQQLAARRGREIELTRQKALGQITAVEKPLITDAYKARKCGLLLNRNTALGGNFANDLTPDVVKALDAAMPTITFDREVEPLKIGSAEPAVKSAH